MRHFIAPFLLVLLVGLLGCEGDYRPHAVGPEGQVTVVIDSSRWKGAVGEAIRENIGPYIETLPTPERAFDLRQFNLSSQRVADIIKEQKNIVFVAPLSDSTNEANFLRRRLSEEARQAVMNGQTAVVAKPNLWRQSQRVYFIAAATPEGLVDALNRQGSEIRRTFKEITLERMQQEMFEKARQFALEDSLMERHGFAVNVQHDYVLVRDLKTDSTGTVLLRRVLTDTWRTLLIHYIENGEPSRISPDWIHNVRDSLTQKYLQGNVAGFMRIDYRRPLETQQSNFLGRFTYETYGLWHMVAPPEETEEGFIEMGGGGPFVNYTFYDQASDRIFMIDGSVFAPGYDKRQFLRQMEVIAQTFRTQADTQQQAEGDEAVAARR